VSNEFSFRLNEWGEVLQKFVINALFDTDLGTDLVLKSSHAERKGGEALVSLSKEVSGLLELQAVNVLQLTLKDGASFVSHLCLTFTS